MEGLLIIILLCLLSIFFMKTHKKQKGGEVGFSFTKIIIIGLVLGTVIYSINYLLNIPKDNQGEGPTDDNSLGKADCSGNSFQYIGDANTTWDWDVWYGKDVQVCSSW